MCVKRAQSDVSFLRGGDSCFALGVDGGTRKGEWYWILCLALMNLDLTFQTHDKEWRLELSERMDKQVWRAPA